MKRPFAGTGAIACALAIGACCAHAADDVPPADADAGGRWHLNGYVTLGVSHVDAMPAWGFVRDLSEPGQAGSLKTGVDSRLGLQLNWQVAGDVELVAQGVLRRQDQDAPLLQHLDWAFAAWRPAPDWTLRVGRTSPDLFLLADYRNVDFAFPWVRPNVEVYGFIALQSLDGLDLAHRWQNDATHWTAKLNLGQSRVMHSSQGQAPDGSRLPGPDLSNKDGLIATLAREENGLTLKATYAQMRSSITISPQVISLRQGLLQLAAAGVAGVSPEAQALADALKLDDVHIRYAALGAQYEAGPWQLMAELSKIDMGPRSPGGQRGYVSAAYRQGSLTPYVMLGRATPQNAVAAAPTQWGAALTPLIGAQAAAAVEQLGGAAAAANNRGRFDQRSTSVGLRWDVSERAALKLQLDRFRIAAGGAGAWSHSDSTTAGRATVATACVDFLF
jgi:hypothetical protein